MLSSSIPSKFGIPFGYAAGAGFIRTIPIASQTQTNPGAASFTDGFPPLTFLDENAGGIPPDGQDFNGLLNQMTTWDQWLQAGGPVPFDPAFAASIGGYPKGSLILSVSGHRAYQSLIDNNGQDPDPTNTAWRPVFSVYSGAAYLCTGSANVQTLTLNPPPPNMGQLFGIVLTLSSVGTNTAGVTLNINGLGAFQILTQGGVSLAPGALTQGSMFQVVWNGTYFAVVSGLNVFSDPSNGGTTIVGSGAQGANLVLVGNGGSTPKKYVRAQNGLFEIVNDAYNAAILTLSDAGDLTVARNLGVGAGITATNSIVTGNSLSSTAQVTHGARGSGDATRVTTLGDWTSVFGGADDFYTINPLGVIDLVCNVSAPWSAGTLTTTIFTLPHAMFPTAFYDVIGGFDGTSPSTEIAMAVQGNSRTSVAVTIGASPSTSGSGTVGVVLRLRGS